MTKQEFLNQLDRGLKGLPKEEIEQRIAFYEEIINDKIEEGLSEEGAVDSLGGVDRVIDAILAEIPLSVIVKRKIKPKKSLAAWEIILLAVGSPVWASILISLFAIAFSIYASIWAVVVSLWAVTFSFAVSALAGIIMLFVGITTGNAPMGFAMLGVVLFLGGLSVFACLGMICLTKWMAKLTVRIPTIIKRCFIGKGDKK